MKLFCRLCGQLSEQIQCKITDNALHIEQKLNDCCRWESYKDFGNLPENVCVSCFDCLERSWRFCQKVATAQIQLKEIFSDSKLSLEQPTTDLKLKDEFMDDDHSFHELPMDSWSEDEMNDVNMHQIKVESFILENADKNDSLISSISSERLHTAKTIDEAIDDNEKLETDKIKFPQCLEPHERNPDGTVDSKAIKRLNLCNWTIYQNQCNECKMIFIDSAELKRHHRAQHPLVTIRHRCWLCMENLSYSKRITLIRHIRRHHIYHLALCCRYCNRHYWDAKAFKVHQKQKAKCQTHLKDPAESVICEYCGQISANLGNHRVHLNAKHLSNELKTVFECYLCKMIVFSRITLKKHIVSNHIGKKLVKCAICNLTMAKTSLARHLVIHSDEMPFICSFLKPCGMPCGKAFKFSRGLEEHERTHTGHRPYKCRAEGCDYATSNRGNIYKHMKQKHKMIFPKK